MAVRWEKLGPRVYTSAVGVLVETSAGWCFYPNDRSLEVGPFGTLSAAKEAAAAWPAA